MPLGQKEYPKPNLAQDDGIDGYFPLIATEPIYHVEVGRGLRGFT
jgi:hypothetical protein